MNHRRIISEFGSDFTEEIQDSDSYGFTEENICGESASCIVYQVRWQGIRVAVKRLRPELLANPANVASYRKEFNIGIKLKHDGLPTYRELKDSPNEMYIVMEYIDGITLDQFLKTEEGQQYFSSPENVRAFFSSLLEIIGYLHRNGVIHCDIKPANIILRNSDRRPMLIDLDKAYSDAFDRTHGGTQGMSQPLSTGSTPTAHKDFEALATLSDFVSKNAAKFPLRSFAGFIRECNNPEATDLRLLEALQPKKPFIQRWGAAIIAAIAIISGTAFYLFWPRPQEDPIASAEEKKTALDSTQHTDETNATLAEGTENSAEINTPEQDPSAATPTFDLPAKPGENVSTQIDIAADFDKRMEPFTHKMQKYTSILTSGKATTEEINQMSHDALVSYSEISREILAAYKQQHPDMAETDIYTAMMKKFEHNQGYQLYLKFCPAVGDTLKSRYIATYESKKRSKNQRNVDPR